MRIHFQGSNLQKVNLALVAAITLAGFLLVASTTSAAQTTTLYLANAYGASANVGSAVRLAPTAPSHVGAGCGIPTLGLNQNNSVASVSLFPLIQTGVNTTSAATMNPANASANATIANVSLVAGLVGAQAVTAASATYVSNHQILYSSAGSGFVNLTVAGIPILGNPAPNTTIPLLGLGRVVLNEQITQSLPISFQLRVNMIHVYVTLPNLLGIPLGTEIIVGSATSSVALYTAPAASSGGSYALGITGGLLNDGPIAQASIPCTSTYGKLVTVTQAGINVPLVLTSGTMTDTARSDITPFFVDAQTTSSVQSLNLLSGLVTVNAMQDKATAVTNNSTNFQFSSSGTFTGLHVAGFPQIGDNVPPNTALTIPGLGTLYLHRVVTTNDSIEVTMVELQVLESNHLGLPLGTDIKIADSSAALTSAQRP
jgi:hypothetical protein